MSREQSSTTMQIVDARPMRAPASTNEELLYEHSYSGDAHRCGHCTHGMWSWRTDLLGYIVCAGSSSRPGHLPQRRHHSARSKPRSRNVAELVPRAKGIRE